MIARSGLWAIAPLLLSFAACEPPSKGPAVGEVAPDIVGIDLDGVQFKLSDYAGKVVFLDFWADW